MNRSSSVIGWFNKTLNKAHSEGPYHHVSIRANSTPDILIGESNPQPSCWGPLPQNHHDNRRMICGMWPKLRLCCQWGTSSFTLSDAPSSRLTETFVFGCCCCNTFTDYKLVLIASCCTLHYSSNKVSSNNSNTATNSADRCPRCCQVTVALSRREAMFFCPLTGQSGCRVSFKTLASNIPGISRKSEEKKWRDLQPENLIPVRRNWIYILSKFHQTNKPSLWPLSDLSHHQLNTSLVCVLTLVT